MAVSGIEAQILEDVISAFALAVGSGLTYVVTKVVPKYIHSKTARNVIDGLAVIAENVVEDFNQRIVSEAKTNGVWNSQLAQQIKRDAVQAVMSQSGNLRALSGNVIGDVESMVGTLIEKAVAKSKNSNDQSQASTSAS